MSHPYMDKPGNPHPAGKGRRGKGKENQANNKGDWALQEWHRIINVGKQPVLGGDAQGLLLRQRETKTNRNKSNKHNGGNQFKMAKGKMPIKE